MQVEDIKPHIGSIIRVDRSRLCDAEVVKKCLELLETRSVVVFPQINVSDEEQLAFTDLLGSRVNFTQRVPGGDREAEGVYTITLDPKVNNEPEYVYGTFFWHMDGMTSGIVPPKASLLSARTVAPKGGQTEFASTCAAYNGLSDEEKTEIADLRAVHTVTAAVREVADAESIDATRRGYRQEHPLVWHRKSGHPTLLVGYNADYIVDMPKPEGRALLIRLLEWAAQPAYTYRHQWQQGDLVVWDNTGALHRVVPYSANSGRTMHRTSVAGVEEVR